jgi:hypothetical protein
MGYTNYPLDHVTPEGVKELEYVVNQFILWNRCKFFLDGQYCHRSNVYN